MTMTSLEVRRRLVEALKLDLVGPWAGHELTTERLGIWQRPSNAYLTGFLVPSGTPPEKCSDEDEDDDFADVPETAGLAEESTDDNKAAKKSYFPSSVGLSFLVDGQARTLAVTVRWGDYTESQHEGADGEPDTVWQRQPREETVELDLGALGHDPVVRDVPGSGGLQLYGVLRVLADQDLNHRLPAGTRSMSLFLINRRPPAILGEERADPTFAFQAELEVRSDRPFIPRPDLRGAQPGAWDDQVAELHYTDTPEYATGHGVSADWEIVEGACRVVRSTWVPSAEVEKTATVKLAGVELGMDALGALADGEAAGAALEPLVKQYRKWIEARRAEVEADAVPNHDTAVVLLDRANLAAKRIEQGIATLTQDPEALDAFRVANRAVARALRQRWKGQPDKEPPRWRAFQLAFLLLNLPGIANPHDPEREIVDLLFFPTGGGKTEAYLGLAAFAMVLRRLRHSEENGKAGAGVCVIMRYTLRLLTLDQLGRAAGLVCALELEREKNAARYGTWPFEIGLWVGKAATPNQMGRKGDKRQDTARVKVRQFKEDPRHRPSPIPLENCPWCSARFEPDSFDLHPNEDTPTELRIVCTNLDCDFIRDRPLPIVAVDEALYRRLPAFLIATVDKFASLPWVGPSGLLLGGADRHDAGGFYGAADPGLGHRLPSPLPPPDLVIQDELHLISGPLGTMTGLYETAIEALCLREVAGRTVRPKIIASTATVRQAADQIQALFGRALTQIFPPPGPRRQDSFFACTVPAADTPARLFLGLASQGRNAKVLMRRAWLALMGAAEQTYQDAGGRRNPANPADPYMTVLGYFNSLRELGGARRILEEEVHNAAQRIGARKRLGQQRGLFEDRERINEVVELTSRVSTDRVAEARRRLELPAATPQRVDCAIATNMISVGLDIPRLGLMVVLGQPKTHSEYIQATSRVGRDEARPGLVVTLLNIHKPRDRSHYERFRHYHETFYRAVEVASLTPFSARALDRGLAGALVSFARHADSRLTPPRGAEHLAEARPALDTRLLAVFEERVRHLPMENEDEREERLRSVHARVLELLDSWRRVLEGYREVGVELQYQRYETKQPQPLLREMLDQEFDSEHHRRFRANRSLRDVEPEVNLFLNELPPARGEDTA